MLCLALAFHCYCRHRYPLDKARGHRVELVRRLNLKCRLGSCHGVYLWHVGPEPLSTSDAQLLLLHHPYQHSLLLINRG